MKISFIFYLAGLICYICVNKTYENFELCTWATYMDMAGVALAMIACVHFIIFDRKLQKCQTIEFFFDDSKSVSDL